MSNMCNFLDHIQDGHFGGRKFATYGDSAFTPMRTCLISRHVSVNGVALTAIQVKENQAMKAIREPIEWSYGEVTQFFQSCGSSKDLRLGYKTSYVKEQLLMCYLMTNVKTCLHGNKIGMEDHFDCVPHRLDTYLRV
jgi:hypothetical protein